MAAGDILQKVGTPQIRFSGSGFSPAVANTNMTVGSPTVVAITRGALAIGAARQSAKANLGTLFALGFEVKGVVDFTGESPQSGSIDYYWSPSGSTTAATDNVAGGAGADAACPDGSVLGSITLAQILLWMDFIGSLTVHDGASVQGPALIKPRWFPVSQYGQLVEVNSSLDIYENDEVEVHTVFNPLVPNIEQ